MISRSERHRALGLRARRLFEKASVYQGGSCISCSSQSGETADQDMSVADRQFSTLGSQRGADDCRRTDIQDDDRTCRVGSLGSIR